MLVAFALATVTLLAASGTGSAGRRVIQFKGHGPKVLPHFRVTAPLNWTNSGSYLQIVSYGGYCSDGAVASQAHRGTSYYPASRYQDLRVAAIGDWAIIIRTGAERVGTPVGVSGSGETGTSAVPAAERQDVVLEGRRLDHSDLRRRPGKRRRDRQYPVLPREEALGRRSLSVLGERDGAGRARRPPADQHSLKLDAR
jgi:hypothetical protein